MRSLAVSPDFLPVFFTRFKNMVQLQLCVPFCILFPYLKHLQALTFLECYKNTVHYNSPDVPKLKHSLTLDTKSSLSPTSVVWQLSDAAHQDQQTWSRPQLLPLPTLRPQQPRAHLLRLGQVMGEGSGPPLRVVVRLTQECLSPDTPQ